MVSVYSPTTLLPYLTLLLSPYRIRALLRAQCRRRPLNPPPPPPRPAPRGSWRRGSSWRGQSGSGIAPAGGRTWAEGGGGRTPSRTSAPTTR
eukprot:1193561-Prorocentrum_minimum.AAC.2